MKASYSAPALTLVLALGGCHRSQGDPDVVHRTIGPAGGTISSPDSVLTIAIPPEALEETLDFFVEASDEPPDVYGQAYLVRPTPQLRYDATVTIRDSLPDDLSHVAVGAVDREAFDSGQAAWTPLPVLRIDQEQGLVTGLDTQISIFYALLDDAEVGSTGGPAGGDETMGTGGETDEPGTGDEATAGTDGGETGDTGEPTTGPGGTTGEPALSFAREIQPIIDANCECHVMDEPAGLSMIDAYANLVNVASTEAAGLDRIEPGAPDDSYLWHKVNGTHVGVGGSGDPMPAPTGGLDAGTLATIEAWILDGAAP